MPDQLTSALLIVVAIAYLGGAVLLIVALAKVLLAWSVSWRTSGQTSPVDVVLQQRAAAAMAAVAAVANVPPPATDVVAILGAPVAGEAEGTVGDGGLAVTRFRAGRPPTVVFARLRSPASASAPCRAWPPTSSATSSAANAVRPRRGTRGWSVTYSSCWQALVSLQLLLWPRPSWPAPRCWPR